MEYEQETGELKFMVSCLNFAVVVFVVIVVVVVVIVWVKKKKLVRYSTDHTQPSTADGKPASIMILWLLKKLFVKKRLTVYRQKTDN